LWSNFSFHHFINNSNISKCSSSHNQIISSSRSISIKIFLFNSSLFQKSSSWRINWYISSRRYMISSYWVPKNSQYICILYMF
jgi:hypothetical protein